jgi:hypothetical protein
MKRRLLSLTLVASLTACAATPPVKFPDSAYEPLPSSYKEIVTSYLNHTLFDPYSAHISWSIIGPFKSSAIVEGKNVPAWSVPFDVNAKNRLGAYVGERHGYALIYHHQVVYILGLDI